MKRTALIVILMAAACGGGKKKDTTTPDTDQAATPAPVEPAPAPAPAPEPAPAPPEPKVDEAAVAAAALTEQYEAGKKVYTEKKCNSCHGDTGAGNKKNPPVIGDKAFPEKAGKTAKLRKKVTFKTAADVMGFVKQHMPLKAPNTLTDEEAAAVTAWMLSESKVNIEKKLDASNAESVTLRAAAADTAGKSGTEPAKPASDGKPAEPAKPAKK
jgi:mono/diheme cytochrome c family protein